MSKIIAYLTFDGNCREALSFYHQCLGGDLSLTPLAGSPAEEHMPGANGNSILHGCLTKGDITLMASDRLCETGPFVQGNSVSLCLDCTTREEIDAWFAGLSAGGTVTSEPQPTFWGAVFGHLTDKFGVQWMLNHQLDASESA